MKSGSIFFDWSIDFGSFPGPSGVFKATNQNVVLIAEVFTDLKASFFARAGQTREITITVQAEGQGTQAIAPIPLPAAASMMLAALAGLGLIGWRRRA